MAGLLVRGAGGDPKKARIAVFQGAELMTAGMGGHVDAIVTVASNILPHVESGKLNMLAVAAPKRLTGALASVPTFKEQVQSVVRNWAGVFGARSQPGRWRSGTKASRQPCERGVEVAVATNQWNSISTVRTEISAH
jgi:tripartite-type tricarboxylate transporter receptor subunit TctC